LLRSLSKTPQKNYISVNKIKLVDSKVRNEEEFEIAGKSVKLSKRPISMRAHSSSYQNTINRNISIKTAIRHKKVQNNSEKIGFSDSWGFFDTASKMDHIPPKSKIKKIRTSAVPWTRDQKINIGNLTVNAGLFTVTGIGIGYQIYSNESARNRLGKSDDELTRAEEAKAQALQEKKQALQEKKQVLQEKEKLAKELQDANNQLEDKIRSPSLCRLV
jgi:hypothetical protein